MTPVECLARLCALIPPPRYPLTRFHGVLAPREQWPTAGTIPPRGRRRHGRARRSSLAGLFLATGHHGSGILLAKATGDAVAAAILER